jgi:hypothetical protein
VLSADRSNISCYLSGLPDHWALASSGKDSKPQVT